MTTISIHQLIYTSAAKNAFDRPALAEILRIARRNNSAVGLTGLLAYHAGSFLQLLEGEEENVAAVFARIQRDPRHGEFRVLLRDKAPAPEFGEWSMAYIDLTESARGSPGFVEYGTAFDEAVKDKTQARRVFRHFKDGLWRRSSGPQARSA
jgi:hypothetical protein